MKRIEKIIAAAVLVVILIAAGPVLLNHPPAVADNVGTGWDFLPFYTTATAPKTGWYHVKTGQMYDKTNNDLAASPTWTDCVTAISVDATTGVFEDTPEATMPGGEYIWRLYDTASPAYTDTPIISKLVTWDKGRKQITNIADL